MVDAGEAYLCAVGKPGWRAGLLYERACLLETLGQLEEAVASAEEAVALELRNPGAPGYTLATYRWALGDLLRQLGRTQVAEHQYRDVLADSDSDPYGRKCAHEGLAWCALDRGASGAARREADAAVRLAEGMGDNLRAAR